MPDGDHVYAVITDTRPDTPLGRPHRDVGTRIEIPQGRYNSSVGDPNLTGHGIIYIAQSNVVLCYYDDSGI